MSERIKFTVWRDEWLRGQGTETSSLLDADGKRCCLGHLARDLGAKDSDLVEVRSPRGALGDVDWPGFLLSRDLDSPIRNSADAFELMRINDSTYGTEEERERVLTELFAEHGIDVEFRDGSGPDAGVSP